MPLLKVAIIEMIATILEKHEIDLEECSKVTLVIILFICH